MAGYSKEPSLSKEPSQRDGSFEHPKHMFKSMGKKTIDFILKKTSLYLPMYLGLSFMLCSKDIPTKPRTALGFYIPVINIYTMYTTVKYLQFLKQ